jgi:hypothetical protein
MKAFIINNLYFITITFCVFILTYLFIKVSLENKQLKWSITANNSEIAYFKTQNGTFAAKINAQELSVKQLKTEIINEIKNLNIKPKNVYNYSETVIKSEKQIITAIRDSIINDTIKAEVFNYCDPFYSISGFQFNNEQIINISSIDSIIQVVHKGDRLSISGRKYPKWFFLVPRRLQQSIENKNPNNKIVFAKYINISK